jgi:cytochrome c2
VIGPGATNLVGPVLNGLDGRHSGSVAGFNYSDANKNSIVWSEQTFGDYIKDPKAKIPGTKNGVRWYQERAGSKGFVGVPQAVRCPGQY